MTRLVYANRVEPLEPSRVRRVLRKMYENDWEVHTGIFSGIVSTVAIMAALVCMLPMQDVPDDDIPPEWFWAWGWWNVALLAAAVLLVATSLTIWRVGEYGWYVQTSEGAMLTEVHDIWIGLPDKYRDASRSSIAEAYRAGKRGDKRQVRVRLELFRALRREVDAISEQEAADMPDLAELRGLVDGLKLHNESLREVQ